MEAIDNLPIQINGNEKYATGLTKRTTIDDVKYAILSCTLNKNETINLNDYAIFERWQGNERILDGKLKIYKLIRLWKSLPGNQLDNVKFIIKKRKNVDAIKINEFYNNHNTASPSVNKTWNKNKAANALRKSTRKRSVSSSSSRDSSVDKENNYDKRYSTIRKFNRSKQSTVCKSSDGRQPLSQLNDNTVKNDEVTKKPIVSLKKRLASKSRERASSIRRLIVRDADDSVKTNDRLKPSVEAMSDGLNNQLNHIDEMISLKSNVIKSLETELKKLEDEMFFQLKNEVLKESITNATVNNKKLTTSSSSSSSLSSSSSILTSVSEQANNKIIVNTTSKICYGDNDSDTGISSANSDDLASYFETLV